MATPMFTHGPTIKLKFCLFPKKCVLSGKKLWLTRAYKSVEHYYGFNGESVTYVNWIEKHQYLMLLLKQ